MKSNQETQLIKQTMLKAQSTSFSVTKEKKMAQNLLNKISHRKNCWNLMQITTFFQTKAHKIFFFHFTAVRPEYQASVKAIPARYSWAGL